MHKLLCFIVLIFYVIKATAFTPQYKDVCIVLKYDVATKSNVMGVAKKNITLPYSYFVLNDIYTNNEQKISSEYFGDGVSALSFKLNHPLYDYINHGGGVCIPFYVEPGDTLVINLSKAGKVHSYRQVDGSKVKYEKLLLHDISNNTFYTEHEFVEDKQGVRFPDFTARVLKRMNTVVDSISRVADFYSFSNMERRIAINNAKLQFGIWIFEYAPYKSMEINAYSSKHKEGWQAIPNQDAEFAELQDINNYAFMQHLPINDSTCMASRYFQQFMISYEHTYFLNSDQYLYYGTSAYDKARMDSAYVAKDLKLTGKLRPSLFMDVALQRKHFEAPVVDDGSIKLQEVEVFGAQNGYHKEVTPEEMAEWRKNQKPTLMEQVFSPSYWLNYRKQYKNRERAKALIEKIEKEEAADNAEREAIMKAYEEEMERQKAMK